MIKQRSVTKYATFKSKVHYLRPVSEAKAMAIIDQDKGLPINSRRKSQGVPLPIKVGFNKGADS